MHVIRILTKSLIPQSISSDTSLPSYSLTTCQLFYTQATKYPTPCPLMTFVNDYKLVRLTYLESQITTGTIY